MFWSGWEEAWRVAVSAVVLYAAVVVILRIAGKRTLSQLNLFDWIVTVALGSMLATSILSPSVSIAAGIVGFSTLVALQFLVAFVQARTSNIDEIIKGEPRLLVHRGELRYDAMREERITEREVMQALRAEGLSSPAEAAAVVLETNGTLSVVRGDFLESERILASLDVRSGDEHTA